MHQAITHLDEAFRLGMSVRPKVGGFPYLAEALRLAGVTRNIWTLPSCQSLYHTELGAVVMQGTPLLTGKTMLPPFDRAALIRALRIDQAGESSLPQFLQAVWEAGVISYDVDFQERKVTYFGAFGEAYGEDYPAVTVQR